MNSSTGPSTRHSAAPLSFLGMKCLIGLSEPSEYVRARLGEIGHKQPLSRHEQQMNPDKVLEAPPGRGILDWLPLLVGKCRLLGLQGFPDAGLQRCIYQ
jgi:hypothetical protein